MITPAVIEPFGFFTWDSLRAGWYLSWRVFVRVLPVFAASAVVGVALMKASPAVGGLLMSMGLCAGAIWSLMLVPKITSQWARALYGYPLENGLQVWWGITWRSLVVSLVAEGLSWDEILDDYPYLEREDIRQALSYAAWLAREEVIRRGGLFLQVDPGG